MAVVGGSIGLIAAMVLVRFMRGMLFEVRAYDPRFFVTIGLGLSIVVLVACLIPALRAAKVDPLMALKTE